jgi:O-antigen/teichoic acid export membrane protein
VFAGFLFIYGFHNVLLLEPLSVLGPSRYQEKLSGYFRVQLTIEIILVAVLSPVTLLTGLVWWRIAPGSALASATVGAALALPFLLVLWLVRRMCYVLHRPAIAAAGSALYLASVVAGLSALRHWGWLGSFTAFLPMGCGSIAATGLVLWQAGLMDRGRGLEPAVPWRIALRENWDYARWLAGSTVLYYIVSQVQLLLTAAYLGLAQAGVLRAILLPASVMTQAITAADMVVLPGLSRDFGRGSIRRIFQKAEVVSFLLGGSALCFVALLSAFAVPAEHLLYGGKYGAYAWLIPVLALVPAASGFAAGYSTALRASQKPYFELLANSVAAPVAVVSGFLFIRWWGLAGAAASMVLGFGFYMLCNCVTFYRLSRKS